MEQVCKGRKRAARMVSHTNVYVLQAVILATQAVQGIKSWLKKIYSSEKGPYLHFN